MTQKQKQIPNGQKKLTYTIFFFYYAVRTFLNHLDFSSDSIIMVNILLKDEPQP